MGMRPTPGSERGLKPCHGFLRAQLNTFSEMKDAGMPLVEVFEFEPLLDSSDMDPSDWVKIGRVILDHYLDYAGFVVVHGTDTMAYSASALSFMLEGLTKPVVFVGSMLPLGQVHSDARRNVLVAIAIAGSCDIPEVCIYFNDSLFRGNRAVKADSFGFAAFDSPNFPVLAKLGTKIQVNTSLVLPVIPANRGTTWSGDDPSPSNSPRSLARAVKLHDKMDNRILVLRVVPGLIDLQKVVITSSVKAVILLSYGTGNAPIRKSSLVCWIRSLVAADVIVIIVTQCLRGVVDLEQYAVGKQLQEVGVLSARDMTCEAAIAKISYLLGKDLSLEDTKKAFSANLRGELTTNVDGPNVSEEGVTVAIPNGVGSIFSTPGTSSALSYAL